MIVSAAQVRSKSERMAQAEQANAELTRQLAAERRAAKQAGAGAQKQLLGCMRRLQYMVHIYYICFKSWTCPVKHHIH